MRGYWIALVTGFCLAALPSATASAQVHVDPNSAPGKEYEIPLDRVRNDASPDANNGAPSGSGDPAPAPAFGVGLEPDGAAKDGSQDGGAKGSGSDDATGGKQDSDDEASGNSATSRAPDVVRTAGTTEGGVGPTLTFTGLGVGALLLGAVAGFVLRRRPKQGMQG
jgi:hypothetical protein